MVPFTLLFWFLENPKKQVKVYNKNTKKDISIAKSRLSIYYGVYSPEEAEKVKRGLEQIIGSNKKNNAFDYDPDHEKRLTAFREKNGLIRNNKVRGNGSFSKLCIPNKQITPLSLSKWMIRRRSIPVLLIITLFLTIRTSKQQVN